MAWPHVFRMLQAAQIPWQTHNACLFCLLQQALYSHEYLKQQNDSGNHPAPAAAAAKSSSGVTQQQQHLWQGDVGSSSLRVSRDSNRELVRQTDSMRGSEANQAELLQLQVWNQGMCQSKWTEPSAAVPSEGP